MKSARRDDLAQEMSSSRSVSVIGARAVDICMEQLCDEGITGTPLLPAGTCVDGVGSCLCVRIVPIGPMRTFLGSAAGASSKHIIQSHTGTKCWSGVDHRRLSRVAHFAALSTRLHQVLASREGQQLQ